MCIAATLDGSLGYLLPLAETTFRRLKMLQIKMVQGLPHSAGLNPKSFRYILLLTCVLLSTTHSNMWPNVVVGYALLTVLSVLTCLFLVLRQSHTFHPIPECLSYATSSVPERSGATTSICTVPSTRSWTGSCSGGTSSSAERRRRTLPSRSAPLWHRSWKT